MVKEYFAGRVLIWSKYIKVFCDNGQPKYYKLPIFQKDYFHPSWELCGFNITWLGRQFFFVFGEDINKLYGKTY